MAIDHVSFRPCAKGGGKLLGVALELRAYNDGTGFQPTHFMLKMNRANCLFLLFTSSSFLISGSPAQEQQKSTEPEFTNKYYALSEGRLQPLEHQTLTVQSKSKNHFVTISHSQSEVVPGSESPVQLAPNAHFVVKIATGGMDPETLIHLRQFKVANGERELLMRSGSVTMIVGSKSKREGDTSIDISVKKYGDKSFEVIPTEPLPPGEYFFSAAGMQVDCFAVTAK